VEVPVESNPRTDDRERERAAASQEDLADRIADHLSADGIVEAAPGLFLNRFSVPHGPDYRVAVPSLCVIAQGSKDVLLGARRYRYDANHYLLISAGVPLEGHVVEATPARPYLAVRLVLEPAVIVAVLIEAGLLASRADGVVGALAVSRLDPELLDAVLRVVRLVDTPGDFRVLAPLAMREIVYRLAQGDQRERLRQIAAVGGGARRIAEAIEILRKEYDRPLRIAALARRVGMSVSSLHHQFKAVTAMSPLQFQKQVRLQEARRLLLAGECDAGTAAFQVGYGDPAHFSRDYKRRFGEPPMRDIERLREQAAGGSSPDPRP
jgi:AraC-like DNA-binding protein